jgi:hypothetical protein
MEIVEVHNDNIPRMAPIRERMDIHIPNIPDGIPKYNGGVWVVSGSGGSGKSSLLLSLFKSKKLYRNKFDYIWYICPMSSFLSVDKHPFQDHDKVYHDLTPDLLTEIYNRLDEIKKDNDEDGEQEYSCLFIDDFADALKDKNIQRALNRILIKARHLKCMIIICVQAWKYFPLQLRRQVTNVSIFKPKNKDEWSTVCKEILMMKSDYWEEFHDHIFSEPYVHLDIDTKTGDIYRNFNKLEIKLPN